MTAGLEPKFTDKESYLRWRKVWVGTHKRLQQDIIRRKNRVKQCQRDHETYMAALRTPHCAKNLPSSVVNSANQLDKLQRELLHFRAVGLKMMTILKDARVRRDRILKMHEDVRNQGFPLDLGECSRVDFHFNRGHNEFPFLPMWVIRAKGKSYYVNEVNASVPWTTRERETGSTKGVLRFPKCRVEIDADGIAKIG